MKKLIDCPAERAVYFLGGKWKIRILFSLLQSKKIRFGELKKGLKTITQQMLSKQLKELESDDIVSRKVFSVIPPKVEYSLTATGKSLNPVIQSVLEWASYYSDQLEICKDDCERSQKSPDCCKSKSK